MFASNPVAKCSLCIRCVDPPISRVPQNGNLCDVPIGKFMSPNRESNGSRGKPPARLIAASAQHQCNAAALCRSVKTRRTPIPLQLAFCRGEPDATATPLEKLLEAAVLFGIPVRTRLSMQPLLTATVPLSFAIGMMWALRLAFEAQAGHRLVQHHELLAVETQGNTTSASRARRSSAARRRRSSGASRATARHRQRGRPAAPIRPRDQRRHVGRARDLRPAS